MLGYSQQHTHKLYFSHFKKQRQTSPSEKPFLTPSLSSCPISLFVCQKNLFTGKKKSISNSLFPVPLLFLAFYSEFTEHSAVTALVKVTHNADDAQCKAKACSLSTTLSGVRKQETGWVQMHFSRAGSLEEIRLELKNNNTSYKLSLLTSTICVMRGDYGLFRNIRRKFSYSVNAFGYALLPDTMSGAGNTAEAKQMKSLLSGSMITLSFSCRDTENEQANAEHIIQ